MSDEPKIRADRADAAGNCCSLMAGFALVLWAVLLPSCLNGCTLQETYVKADELTYEAIAPEYRAYVEGDSALDDKQKERRGATLDSWEARLKEAGALEESE